MQGSGSSLELARPRGEGGLRRQDRMPFPEPAGGTLGGGRGAPHMGAGSVGEPPPCSWGTRPQRPGRWRTHPWRRQDGSHLNTKSTGCWGRSGERGRKSAGREDVR